MHLFAEAVAVDGAVISLRDCTFSWLPQEESDAAQAEKSTNAASAADSVSAGAANGAAAAVPVPAVSCLHHISMHVRPGELVCIVGAVGSGKSSLLSAISGEHSSVVVASAC